MTPQYMYKRLTCRQWKLNPTGCFDGSIHCKYSHFDTGIMSPPIGTTCRSWKDNCCTLHENNCLFTHLDTGRPPSSFTFRKPALTGRNAAIAKAAAAAGFDVTDTTNFIDLIYAIRDADRALYPDRYEGSARYKSGLYPDHWVAAEIHQQKGITEYRDLEKFPSVPAFSFNAQRIIREQLDGDAISCSARRNVSSANREPLGTRTSRKRTADDFTPRPASKTRKISEDHTTDSKSYQSSQRTAFDLTQEKYVVHTSARSSSSCSCSSCSTLGSFISYRSVAPGRTGKKRQKTQHFHQQSVRTTTSASLYKVLQTLRLSEANLEKDREILKERWELDTDLQLQTVTNDLQDLNGCFIRAKNAIREAIAIVEERLL